MKLGILAAAALAALASTQAQAAVTITSIKAGTATYSGPTPTFDFDTATPAYTGGKVINYTNATNAQPFGSTGNYYSVSPEDGPGTILLSSLGGISSLSFLWGSVDYGNTVQFFNTAGSVIGTFTGFGIWGAGANGDRTSPTTNSVVTFGFSGADQAVARMVLTTFAGGNNPTGQSFEIDNLAISSVPELGSWALMTAGLAMVGASLRRRRRAAGTLASA